jgi:hypothetical protein
LQRTKYAIPFTLPPPATYSTKSIFHMLLGVH